jgi:epsilon-lactone hydrolase
VVSNEFLAFVESLRAHRFPDDLPFPELRRVLDDGSAPDGSALVDVVCTPVVAGGLDAEWVTPRSGGRDRSVLYLHGGGYTIGSIRTHRHLAAAVAVEADARVLLVEYRLAPEHPHPAAIDDALAAWCWMVAEVGGPGRCAIVGDSAGGGLAVATMVRARAEGLPLPACAVTMSGWFDLTLTAPTMDTRADADPMCQRAGLARMAAAYLDGGDPEAPLASPLFADLRELPPLFVQVGDAEVLLDDSRALVTAARNVGVEASLEVWDGMIHVFQGFAAMFPEGREALRRVGAFVREHA